MNVTLRPATTADIPVCGRILYDAFKSIADRHNFPQDFASVEMATQVMSFLVKHGTFFGAVAEMGGRVVGSNFLAQRDAIHAVGPISVDPGVQGSGAGRRLMQAVIEAGQSAPGIRLVQDAFNTVSMPLYASLGFHVREPLVLLSGTPKGRPVAGVEVRPLTGNDLDECGALCTRVHGFDRLNELRDAQADFAPFVAVRGGRITAYTTVLSVWTVAHGVAASEDDMRALMLGVAAATRQPLSFLLPTRQASLFHWCLTQGLRVVKPMTLMTMGAYQEPAGCFFPSVAY